jgi:transposase InsO family protein
MAVFSGDPREQFMSESSNGRRRPMSLSAETKWEIFLQITAGEITQAEAARKWRVDVSTVIGIRRTVKDAALAALARKPGRPGTQTRLAARSRSRGDHAADRGGESPSHRAGDRAGKIRLGLSGPVPARVPAEVKELVLKTVDEAVAAGFAHTWACSVWRVSDSRVHRWRARCRDTGTLVDRAPGGQPMHALLAEEIAAVLDVAERWGTVDRSHRKLAHRGSYEQLVWVSPSTFRRVLIDQGLSLPEPQPRSRSAKKPWPDWLVWEPNRIWIWDATHFTRSRRVCFAIVDMVSRKWIDTLVSVEETATQVQVIFEHAIEVEGLLELLTDERLDLDTDDPRRPILLAVSDNGPPMKAQATRAFMALMAIAQHHGRPHTPQDYPEDLVIPSVRR